MAVTDTALLALANHRSCLESFNLYGNTRVTDTGLVALIKARGKDLRSVGLGSCEQVTDVSVGAFAAHYANMEFLGLTCQLDGKSNSTMVASRMTYRLQSRAKWTSV
mmetsp:Transcript_33284/g.56985  ORF Transcript_33284/g.56985 Transcript_33284/m.56985 type:complete len:107 (+) Transcript_33284:403-723(+)